MDKKIKITPNAPSRSRVRVLPPQAVAVLKKAAAHSKATAAEIEKTTKSGGLLGVRARLF